jgi:mRNA-degrading endonuclease RelE of RelBE toxin-antitoxin system
LLEELDKKLNKLKINPGEVDGMLSGKLHDHKSTRLAKNFRLIFKVEENKVFLLALDHRGRVYD